MDADAKICHSGGVTSASSPDMSYHWPAFWRQSTEIFLNSKGNMSHKSRKYFSTITKALSLKKPVTENINLVARTWVTIDSPSSGLIAIIFYHQEIYLKKKGNVSQQ